jgi:D-xylose transport system permease protein
LRSEFDAASGDHRALVIGSISNGMDLLALSSSVKFMITGAVLLIAVSIDALSRRGRQSAGRA